MWRLAIVLSNDIRRDEGEFGIRDALRTDGEGDVLDERRRRTIFALAACNAFALAVQSTGAFWTRLA